MKNHAAASSCFRRFPAMVAAACLVLASSVIIAVAPSAAVVAVHPTRVADLVILDHGFNAGLRQGMICRITRAAAAVAEVQLVEVRPASSAALILSVASHQSIRRGDVVAVKILKT